MLGFISTSPAPLAHPDLDQVDHVDAVDPYRVLEISNPAQARGKPENADRRLTDMETDGPALGLTSAKAPQNPGSRQRRANFGLKNPISDKEMAKSLPQKPDFSDNPSVELHGAC
jgi:hypothetical protein